LGNVVAGDVISDAFGHGGGIAIDGGGPVLLSGNSLINNSAAIITGGVSYGGGVYASAVTLTLNSNVIQGNQANAAFAFSFGGAFGYGGGVYIVDTPAFTLSGNRILSNTAGYKYYMYLSGGGLQMDN